MDYIITGEDSVIKHWLSLGASGFRLDVADELPDEFIFKLRSEPKKATERNVNTRWEKA